MIKLVNLSLVLFPILKSKAEMAKYRERKTVSSHVKKENPYTYTLDLISIHHPFLVANANH